MNVFNRLFVLILLLAIGAAAVSVAILTWTIPVETTDFLADGVQWLRDDYGDAEKLIVTTGALLIALVAVIFVMVELTPRSKPEVKVTDLQGGEAYLSTASIGQRVEEAVGRVPSVTDVKANVTPKRKGVTVALDLHVDPQANVAVVTQEAIRTARDVMTNQVHVSLEQQPLAHVHYREMNLTRGGSQRRNVPIAPPAPVPAAATVGAGMAPPHLPERTVAPPPTATLERRRIDPPAEPAPPPPPAPIPAPMPPTPPAPPVTPPEPARPSSGLPPSPVDANRLGKPAVIPSEPQQGERVVDEYERPIEKRDDTSNGGPPPVKDDRPGV